MAGSLDRRTIASWCLYDFANSFYIILPAVVWQTYYQRAIVGNQHGEGDLWWGRVISASMFLVAVSSPWMGAISDHAGVRKRLLILYTLASVTAVCLFTTVAPGAVAWGFVVSVVSYVGFEGALVFYNSYLPEIAPPDYQGRVSGWGFGVGYAGSLLGLLLAFPLVNQKMFGATWLAIASAYLIFALPAFRWLPPDAPARLSAAAAARAGARETWRTFREILGMRELRRFFLAYLFFEDGVNTVIVFAAGFAVQTLGFTDTESILLFLVVQLSALVGAFVWAKPTDRLGPKRVVLMMLVQWSLAVTMAYFVAAKATFFVVAVIAGTGLGAIQAASRTFMASLVPKGREGDFFGFYALSGKSASVLGPLMFGEVSRAAGGNQRLAILSVLVLFAAGAALVSRVRAGGPTARLAESPAE